MSSFENIKKTNNTSGIGTNMGMMNNSYQINDPNAPSRNSSIFGLQQMTSNQVLNKVDSMNNMGQQNFGSMHKDKIQQLSKFANN